MRTLLMQIPLINESNKPKKKPLKTNKKVDQKIHTSNDGNRAPQGREETGDGIRHVRFVWK